MAHENGAPKTAQVPTLNGRGPAVTIYFDPETQGVVVALDASQVKTRNFALALVQMAVEDQEHTLQMERIQARQMAAQQLMADQALAQKIIQGR